MVPVVLFYDDGDDDVVIVVVGARDICSVTYMCCFDCIAPVFCRIRC